MRDGRAGWGGMAAVLLCGCALAPDIQRRVEKEAAGVVQAQAGAAAQPAVAGAAGELPGLETVLRDVVRADHAVRLAVTELQATGLERQAAARQIWPRLVAEGLVELPVRDGNVDTQVSGGLFLRLDLLRAFLTRTAVTAAEVALAAHRALCRDVAQEAVCGFFRRAEAVEAALRDGEHREAALQLAKQASSEARELFRAGQASFEREADWSRRALDQEIECRRAAVRLDRARRELARAYPGPVPESELVRWTLDQLAQWEGEPAAPEEELARILEESPAVTKAKLAWFLAEMAVLDARLKRLPVISFDLGAGAIPIQGDEEEDEADLVPMLRVSVPLFDWGDISRGVKRARLRAEQSREQMRQAVETTQDTWLAIRQELSQAQDAREAARDFCATLRQRSKEIQAIRDSGAATVLDAREVEWMQLEAEIQAGQAEHAYRQALLVERAARGGLLEADWLEDLDRNPGGNPP